MAARAAKIDAVDGPFGDLRNEAMYPREAIRARSLGMVGKWAIHPSRSAPALSRSSPARRK